MNAERTKTKEQKNKLFIDLMMESYIAIIYHSE